MKTRSRRYDEKRGCHVYDISFRTAVPLTERTAKVAEAFGLGIDEEKEHVLYKDFELRLSEGDVVYVMGDSGSGKSVLLKALQDDLGDQAINMAEVAVDQGKPLIDTVGATFQESLGLLSRVGLNDAFLFLRCYPDLSDGQKYRYRIAKMMDSGRRFWLADEFCSTLDRTTAKIVAHNIQKMARQCGVTLIVATTHTDLEEDLGPSVLIRKGWGDEIGVEYRANANATTCTVVKDVVVREGSGVDYHRLSHLHYRSTRLPSPLKIFAMERGGDLVGVVAYSFCSPLSSGRKAATGHRPSLEELNRDWAVISRVIVHPKYRAAGLGSRLIRDTMPLAGRRHIELVAVMAQYNPFAERAGMRLILRSEPSAEVKRAVEGLRALGFDPAAMASASYDLRVLGGCGRDRVVAVKGILLGAGYPARLMGRSGFRGRVEFGAWLDAQSLGGLAGCVSRLGVLGASKAYLYWCRDWVEGGG